MASTNKVLMFFEGGLAALQAGILNGTVQDGAVLFVKEEGANVGTIYKVDGGQAIMFGDTTPSKAFVHAEVVQADEGATGCKIKFTTHSGDVADEVEIDLADVFVQSLKSYNADTNTLTIELNDGTTVDIDMSALIEDAVADRIAKVEGTTDGEVALFDGQGGLKKSDIKVGGDKLTAEADEKTLATEAAVKSAVDAATASAVMKWQTV